MQAQVWKHASVHMTLIHLQIIVCAYIHICKLYRYMGFALLCVPFLQLGGSDLLVTPQVHSANENYGASLHGGIWHDIKG